MYCPIRHTRAGTYIHPQPRALVEWTPHSTDGAFQKLALFSASLGNSDDAGAEGDENQGSEDDLEVLSVREQFERASSRVNQRLEAEGDE